MTAPSPVISSRINSEITAPKREANNPKATIMDYAGVIVSLILVGSALLALIPDLIGSFSLLLTQHLS